VSPDQRPSRITPSKKQLAAEAEERRSRKGRRTTTKAATKATAKGDAKAAGSGRSTGGSSSRRGSSVQGAVVVDPGGDDPVDRTADASVSAVEPGLEPGPAGNRVLDVLLPRSPERFIVHGARTGGADVGAPSDGRRYGWVAIVVAWFGAQILAGLVYALVIPNTDYDPTAVVGIGGRVGEASSQYASGVGTMALSQPVPLWLQMLLQVPLWLVLIAVPVWFAVTRGRGVVADLGLRMKPIDAPVGLAIGVASQLVLVPVLYWLLFALIGDQDVSAAARQLTDRATNPLSIVLVFVIVGIGAPIAEEIFFRGTALPIFGRRLQARWAVFASGAFFAATHFQLLQFPALLVFGIILGVVTVRTRRLGPALWAHLGFNVIAAAGLIFGFGVL
jgi:membrane protease YdiL (CAAX protease family)